MVIYQENWGGVRQLVVLLLFDNQLSGSIPDELGQLSQLEKLTLSQNRLSGTIPRELGELGQLNSLQLTENQLSGPIPEGLGQLSQLEKLTLSQNKLSGTIPRELGGLRKLEALTLNANQLSGSIPKELGELRELEYLSLNSNHLSGAIPGELGQLSQLKYLYLYKNMLSGTFPEELASLSKLSTLTISDNCISSEFSSSPILDRITELDIGNQDICKIFSSQQHIPIVHTVFNLLIEIPLIEVSGQFYSASLSRYNNLIDEQGLYWTLDDIELVNDKTIMSQENPAVEFDTESLQLSFNKIHFREQILAATLLPYNHPNDVNGFYFQYSPEKNPPNAAPEIEKWPINAHLIELNCGRGVIIDDIQDTLSFDGEKYYFTSLDIELTDFTIRAVIDIGLGITITEIDFSGNSLHDGGIIEGSLNFTSGEHKSVVGIFSNKGSNECSKSWTIGSL